MNLFIKLPLLFAFIFIISKVDASYFPWSDIEKKFRDEKLNTKALSHIQCFFEKFENSTFQKKVVGPDDPANRCGGTTNITLDKKRVFALIDYTAPSDERRMFLVDRITGGISSMAVAHGRYNAKVFNNQLSDNKNSVKDAKYFSNEIGSNAPSSGFFVAGGEYDGKFGRSLVLHGLEADINDNACERAVVIHKHLLMTKSSAQLMSSGCPMISKSYIDHVIEILKGSDLDNNGGDELYGAVVFTYGPRESSWETGTCAGNFRF